MGCQEGGFRFSDSFFVDAASGRAASYSVSGCSHTRSISRQPLFVNGTFRSDGDSGVTVNLVATQTELTESSGTWGGKFSNIQDANGAPRLVAGTVGTSFKSSLGGEGAFLGTFVGLNQSKSQLAGEAVTVA